MKKNFALLTTMLMLSSCGNNSASSLNCSNNVSGTSNGSDSIISTNHKILLVYFSCTGTTERVATKIANNIEATTFKIEPKVPYTSEDLNYSNSNCRAKIEQNDSTSRPEIANQLTDVSSYDTLILGYPIWWGKAPKIIYTFLESYDFETLTIYPFCTSGSSPIDGSESDLHSICNASTWKNGRRLTTNSSNDDIKNWLVDLYN